MQQWKKIIQNDGLMNGKFNASSLIVHMQKYKFIDFLYDLFKDMKNYCEYPDYHSVLSRTLDASSDNPSKQVYVFDCGGLLINHVKRNQNWRLP